MSNPFVYLNKSYLKKDGSYAVYIVINIDNQTLRFPTGVSCKQVDFIEETQRIRGYSKKVRDANLCLERSLSILNDIMVRYRLSNEVLTADALLNEWKNPSRRIDFYSFLDEAMKDRKNDLAPQTYKNHTTMAVKLKEFKKQLTFAEINSEFLEQFARWMKNKKNNDINTVHTTMKFLKAYMHIAVKKGIIEKSPFDNFKVLQVQTERVYLNREELKILWDLYESAKLSPPKQSNLRHFLFMCFTGVRISDFRQLTKYNISYSTLSFMAEKTKNIKRTFVKVPLNEQAKRLIRDENSKMETLFNPVTDQKLNKYIKEICSAAGICKNVTNHSGRHTFATLWLEETNDLAALQKLLGHSRITDTMVYTHISDEKIRASMNNFNPLANKNPGGNPGADQQNQSNQPLPSVNETEAYYGSLEQDFLPGLN